MLKITVYLEGGCVRDVVAESRNKVLEHELVIVDYDEELIQEQKDRKNGLYGPEYPNELF